MRKAGEGWPQGASGAVPLWPAIEGRRAQARAFCKAGVRRDLPNSVEAHKACEACPRKANIPISEECSLAPPRHGHHRRVDRVQAASTVAATAEDLAFLQDWGQPIAIGAATGLGMLSIESSLVLDGGAIHHGPSLLTAATLAAALAHGDTLSVGADTYRVQYQPSISPDGVLSRIPLSGPVAAPPPAPTFQPLTTTTGLALTTTTGLGLTIT